VFVSVFVRKWGLRFSSCHSLSVAFIVFLFLIDLSHYRSWGPSTLRNVDDQYVRKRQILEGPFDCLFVCLFFKIAESWKFLLLHKVNSVQFSSVAQSCLTLCNPMDCSTPGLHPSPTPRVYPNSCPLSQWCHLTISSSVHGISQARILEWVAITFFRISSRPRYQTHISCVGRWILYH